MKEEEILEFVYNQLYKFKINCFEFMAEKITYEELQEQNEHIEKCIKQTYIHGFDNGFNSALIVMKENIENLLYKK